MQNHINDVLLCYNEKTGEEKQREGSRGINSDTKVVLVDQKHKREGCMRTFLLCTLALKSDGNNSNDNNQTQRLPIHQDIIHAAPHPSIKALTVGQRWAGRNLSIKAPPAVGVLLLLHTSPEGYVFYRPKLTLSSNINISILAIPPAHTYIFTHVYNTYIRTSKIRLSVFVYHAHIYYTPNRTANSFCWKTRYK